MKIALLGYGKMGKRIETLAEANPLNSVVLKINSANLSALTKTNLKEADVAIEFSNPESVVRNIYLCLDAGVPVVVGTTGWYEHLGEIKEQCIIKDGAILYASNFSIGVNLFFELNCRLAQLMKKQDYDVTLSETHHVQKKDSPSGTALTLAADLIALSEKKTHWKNISGQESTAEIKDASELIILSRREGNVVGIHEVEYQSETDKITIHHEAFSRDGFARGAIYAAEWVRDKKGFYEFKDILPIS